MLYGEIIALFWGEGGGQQVELLNIEPDGTYRITGF